MSGQDERVARFEQDYPRRRVFEIPAEGRGEPFVVCEVAKAMARIPASYVSHQEMAKPGTVNDELAARMYILAMTTANPNNVDAHMFLGAYELEREAVVMTARLLNHPGPLGTDGQEDENYPGWFLAGGTESIVQATWIYRNKYFFERFAEVPVPEYIKERGGGGLFRDLFSLRKWGWFGVSREYQKFFGNRRRVPMPKIVAPINTHFALDKAADLLGFGQENVARFFLRPDGRPDPNSLRRTLERIRDEGDEVAMIWFVVGDTQRGILSDVEELVDQVRDFILDMEYKPPVLIDAAAQYLFAAVMRDSEHYVDGEGHRKTMPTWDFTVPEVQAIVCDAHKNQLPYPASILLLRDRRDMNYSIMNEAYLSLDMMRGLRARHDYAQAHATISTSRAGYGAVAAWAYYVGHGLAAIRQRKERVWLLVLRLRQAITEGTLSSIYELVCEPESALVAFRLRLEWIRQHWDAAQAILTRDGIPLEEVNYLNMLIYMQINQSANDFLYIARSEESSLMTEGDFQDYWGKKKLLRYTGKKEEVYDHVGLMAHIMEHNREEDIDYLIQRLAEEAHRLVSPEGLQRSADA